jgi:hypothetical protein
MTTRMLGFRLRISCASAATAGATTQSIFVEVIASAAASSMPRFSATMPPNALKLSASRARMYASAIVVPIATPHGFVCLITAAAGTSNSRTIRAAASRSSRLVNESSLPCSSVASPKPQGLPVADSRSGARYHVAR